MKKKWRSRDALSSRPVRVAGPGLLHPFLCQTSPSPTPGLGGTRISHGPGQSLRLEQVMGRTPSQVALVPSGLALSPAPHRPFPSLTSPTCFLQRKRDFSIDRSSRPIVQPEHAPHSFPLDPALTRLLPLPPPHLLCHSLQGWWWGREFLHNNVWSLLPGAALLLLAPNENVTAFNPPPSYISLASPSGFNSFV